MWAERGRNMTKSELISKVSEKACITKADTEKVLDAFSKVVTGSLVVGEKVVYPGLGTFEVAERAARTGRNPQTGKIMQIKASKTAKFKGAKALKDALNQ